MTCDSLDVGASTATLLDVLTGAAPRADWLELGELARLGAAEMADHLGLDEQAASRLFAAFEIGRRRALAARPTRPILDSPAAVHAWASPGVRDLRIEVFRSLVVDSRNQLVADETVSRGVLTASLVHPREVFRPALVRTGAALVVVHNHPSGDPEPSNEDDAVTERLYRAGELLGVALLDHVIIGDGVWWSYREHGVLDRLRAAEPAAARTLTRE